MTALVQAGIPSPSVGVWYVGPVPLRAYGIIIAVGMVVALAWASRRYGRRGGDPDLLFDLALWAIPLGIVGARLYHVITSPEQYFGPSGDPWQVWQIWRGGPGIARMDLSTFIGGEVAAELFKVPDAPAESTLPEELGPTGRPVPDRRRRPCGDPVRHCRRARPAHPRQQWWWHQPA